MALSLVQFAAIAGGRAADIIKADDVRRSKEYNDAFNDFIDNNVGAIKKASAKRLLLENKMKKDISQIVNTYVKGNNNITDVNMYEVANAIYASHGYSLENVTKDVVSRKRNHLMNNLTESEDSNTFNYVDAYITNPKDLKSERTLDQIAKKNAQELVPQPTLDLAAKAKGLGRFKETAFTSPDVGKIESDLLAATGYKEDEVLAEGPSAQFKGPVSDEMEMQRFRNLKAAYEKGELDRKKLLQTLETGDFDINQINKLYRTNESNQYAKAGLAKGIGSGGYLTPEDYGKKTQQARMEGFKITVQQIMNAKQPANPYISQDNVKAALIAIAKGLNPITQTDKFEIGGVYVRQLSQNKKEKYIYLGEGVPEIRIP